ncbi:arabinogalactan protein 23-like [Actinidia eriantha]|uniref:arabinogalactan protein 23-like n=1 Tax=Actinidia eriantha TaxID=165200 RepID=UPI0025871DC8|nr:arabinogalactan protein 23-like [Actinidia eriantha]
MEMKKIAFAALVAAVASMSAAMGATDSPAPAPASDATASLPTVGTLVGASLLSFFTYYMH